MEPSIGRDCVADPSKLSEVDSRILRRVRDEFGVGTGGFVCLGGFKNVRDVFEWKGLKLELDETMYDFGTCFEIECESSNPEEAKQVIEGFLKENGISYSDSEASKFAIFRSGKLPQINLDKSELIPVGCVDDAEELAAAIGCKDGVEERMRKKLARWKSQYISKGGRITLIRSTLASMPIYFMSMLPMPRKIRLRLERIQRDFLWGGGALERKLHLVRKRLFGTKRLGEVWGGARGMEFKGSKGGLWSGVVENSWEGLGNCKKMLGLRMLGGAMRVEEVGARFSECWPATVKEMLLGWNGTFVGKKRKVVWKASPLCLFWTVWKTRNKVAFEE
ncbi:Triphosphate tunel metalloenzyme 3 [Vitis vinifera]|uniref:Triphosphate tunel metalloenzyme 3 n=1 Tax=Vitis vinifera TaxID=29760 RepID=A0A438E893_VITVI|nr:Triphosphate tunel metalloenzyme 3 [Vitis vinifera]